MAKPSQIFQDRVLKVAYLDAEKRQVDARKLFLENKMRSLADIEIRTLSSIAGATDAPCDLLIISASHIPGEDFEKWLDGLCHKMSGLIWIPALILAKLEDGRLETLLKKIIHQNWYFDIVDPEHMDSLPIRVANLIRIHDHLQELQRYDDELSALGQKLANIESQLKP